MNIVDENSVAEFIRGQIPVSAPTVTLADKYSGREPLDDYLFRSLTRSAFRRSRIDDESCIDLKNKLRMSIAAGTPITFAIPFGGYKNYQADSFPDPDWAEVFNINYLLRYITPLAYSYAPGAILQYTYCSGVMDKVSNLPQTAPIQYMDKFKALLSLFESHIPNIGLEAVDIAGFYEKGELHKEFVNNYADNKILWVEKFSAEEREKRYDSASRNLMRLGAVDMSDLTAEEWDARCLDAAMWCEALDSLTHRRRFNKFSKNIQLVFVRGPSKSIHVGSCETSAHHFWSGSGVIERRKDRLAPRILSEAKLAAFFDEGRVTTFFQPGRNNLTDISSVYQKIRVLEVD